jgi:hypothetical protein
VSAATKPCRPGGACPYRLLTGIQIGIDSRCVVSASRGREAEDAIRHVLAVLALRVRVASSVGNRRARIAGLATVLSVLILVPLISACGNPKLSYVFDDGDHRNYKLSMAVAEKGPTGETLGTVALEVVLRADVNINKVHPSACFVTVDYEDAKMSTTGSAQSSGNQIPRAYFHLYGPQDRLLTFTGPAWRGGNDSVELARTGPNGSLSVMLLNTIVGKCFAQPLRNSLHRLKIGNEWTTIREFPGEFLTYTYTAKRPTDDQNRETTQAKVAGLMGEGEFAELAWSSATPLWSSRQVDLTDRLLQSGMDPSEVAGLTPAEREATVTMSGSSNCSGIAFVQTSDGWPQRASVDRMTVDLTSSWSYPDLLSSEEPGPVQMILEITGSIEAIS